MVCKYLSKITAQRPQKKGFSDEPSNTWSELVYFSDEVNPKTAGNNDESLYPLVVRSLSAARLCICYAANRSLQGKFACFCNVRASW